MREVRDLVERVRDNVFVGCSIVGIAGAAALAGTLPFVAWQCSLDAPVRTLDVQQYGKPRPIPREERERQRQEREAMRGEYERMKASGDRSSEFHSLKAVFEPDGR